MNNQIQYYAIEDTAIYDDDDGEQRGEWTVWVRRGPWWLRLEWADFEGPVEDYARTLGRVLTKWNLTEATACNMTPGQFEYLNRRDEGLRTPGESLDTLNQG